MDDINLIRGTVTVRYKPEYGFSPKNYREREIPIPARLGKEVKALKARSDKTCALVFPTSGCNPKQNFLDDLKACAERAKLKKADFWLHGSLRRRIVLYDKIVSETLMLADKMWFGYRSRYLLLSSMSYGDLVVYYLVHMERRK